MLEVRYEPDFLRIVEKIKDALNKEKVKKQIAKIIANPELGKLMRYNRRGTRELYIKPFRLSYCYIKYQNLLIFLDLYHKDKQ